MGEDPLPCVYRFPWPLNGYWCFGFSSLVKEVLSDQKFDYIVALGSPLSLIPFVPWAEQHTHHVDVLPLGMWGSIEQGVREMLQQGGWVCVYAPEMPQEKFVSFFERTHPSVSWGHWSCLPSLIGEGR